MSIFHLSAIERDRIAALRTRAGEDPIRYFTGMGEAGEAAFRAQDHTLESATKEMPAASHQMLFDDGHFVIYTYDQQRDGSWIWHLSVSHISGARVSESIVSMLLREFGITSSRSTYKKYYGER